MPPSSSPAGATFFGEFLTSTDSVSLILRRLDEIERKLQHILEELRIIRSAHRMDIHAPRCLNMGAISSWRNDHEKAQYPWDYRWSRVIECGALFASVVAKECGALP